MVEQAGQVVGQGDHPQPVHLGLAGALELFPDAQHLAHGQHQQHAQRERDQGDDHHHPLAALGRMQAAERKPAMICGGAVEQLLLGCQDRRQRPGVDLVRPVGVGLVGGLDHSPDAGQRLVVHCQHPGGHLAVGRAAVAGCHGQCRFQSAAGAVEILLQRGIGCQPVGAGHRRLLLDRVAGALEGVGLHRRAAHLLGGGGHRPGRPAGKRGQQHDAGDRHRRELAAGHQTVFGGARHGRRGTRSSFVLIGARPGNLEVCRQKPITRAGECGRQPAGLP